MLNNSTLILHIYQIKRLISTLCRCICPYHTCYCGLKISSFILREIFLYSETKNDILIRGEKHAVSPNTKRERECMTHSIIYNFVNYPRSYQYISDLQHQCLICHIETRFRYNPGTRCLGFLYLLIFSKISCFFLPMPKKMTY